MGATIFYFSSTGNSLEIARQIAKELNACTIKKKKQSDAADIIIRMLRFRRLSLLNRVREPSPDSPYKVAKLIY